MPLTIALLRVAFTLLVESCYTRCWHRFPEQDQGRTADGVFISRRMFQQMSAALSPNYIVGRPSGLCAVTGVPILPGQTFIAALRETPIGFERVDVSEAGWGEFPRDAIVAHWKSTMPRPEEKKRLMVDDQSLCDLLERLEGVEEPAKQSFRFVLALILLRKKLVQLESTRHEAAGDIWKLKFRGKDQTVDVLDPKPDEEQIAQVREQLSMILNEDVP